MTLTGLKGHLWYILKAFTHVIVAQLQQLLLLLQPFYSPLDSVWDYLGEPASGK